MVSQEIKMNAAAVVKLSDVLNTALKGFEDEDEKPKAKKTLPPPEVIEDKMVDKEEIPPPPPAPPAPPAPEFKNHQPYPEPQWISPYNWRYPNPNYQYNGPQYSPYNRPYFRPRGPGYYYPYGRYDYR